MFDKYKARFAKFEEDHESVRKGKAHVEKYQMVYATLGGGAVTLVAVKLFGGPQVIVKDRPNLPTVIHNTVAPVIHNENVGNQLVNNGGHLTKMVKRLSDGSIWETVTDAAESNDIPLSVMSRHINGHKPDAHGEVFKIVGIGTTGVN